jgi:hypothetical protein
MQDIEFYSLMLTASCCFLFFLQDKAARLQALAQLALPVLLSCLLALLAMLFKLQKSSSTTKERRD